MCRTLTWQLASSLYSSIQTYRVRKLRVASPPTDLPVKVGSTRKNGFFSVLGKEKKKKRKGKKKEKEEK